MGNRIHIYYDRPEEENDDFLENVNVIKENGECKLEEYYEKSFSMFERDYLGFIKSGHQEGY